MGRIVVCPAGEAGAVAREFAPSHAVSIGSPGESVPEVAARHRLALAFHDIDASRAGLVPPLPDDVAALLAFGAGWTGEKPLLVHCRMGISRSTAAAFALACLYAPGRPEAEIAAALRAAAPCATPNPRLVALADDALGRLGRMREAIRAIGRGADYAPYRSFTLEVGE